MILYHLITYRDGIKLSEIEIEPFDGGWRTEEYDFYGETHCRSFYKSDLDKVQQCSVYSFSLSTAAKLLQEHVLGQKEYYTDILNDINGQLKELNHLTRQLKELEDKYVRSK